MFFGKAHKIGSEVNDMKKAPWKAYLFFLVLTETVGGLAGILTRNGVQAYADLPKSPLTPPDLVFPIVWTILFALMGIGAALVFLSDAPGKTRALAIFAVQLAVNFAWSLLFFNLQAFGFALVWLLLLWVLILWMIVSFYKVRPLAAWLQIPYLLWVTFAAYLNYAVWALNR